MVSVGVTAERREVLGMDVGDSEDEAFRTAFLGSLTARGLTEVQQVIADDHAGLQAAIDAVLDRILVRTSPPHPSSGPPR